jgi:zinc protease
MKPGSRFTVAALTILWLARATAAEPTRLDLPVVRYQLANGLVVVLHEDHRLPTVVVDVGVRAGSADESPGRTGLAHLFEHLMFMGTARVPNGAFDGIMESSGGQNNGSTTQDRTSYLDWGPARLLETFLWLESDRLAHLPAAMTPKKLALQRDVVENERREEIENRPYGRVEEILPTLLYPPAHPYHHPIIGSHADLQAARVEEAKAFFARHYAASNLVLVVTGDFSAAAARPLVARYFGWLPSTTPPPRVTAPPLPPLSPQRATLDDDVTLPRVVLAWRSPADFAPGDAACDLVAAILGAGTWSRLHQSLVYDKKLAQSIDVQQESARLGSQLVITATAQAGHTTAELERALDDELARLTTTAPPTARELERARAYVLIESLRELAEPTRLAEQLLTFELRFADPAQLATTYLSRYDAVTLDEATRVARDVLRAPRVTIFVEPRRK